MDGFREYGTECFLCLIGFAVGSQMLCIRQTATLQATTFGGGL